MLEAAELIAEIPPSRPRVLWLGAAVSMAEPASARMAGPVRATLVRLRAGQGDVPATAEAELASAAAAQVAAWPESLLAAMASAAMLDEMARLRPAAADATIER